MKSILLIVILAAFAIMTIVGFAAMGIDKRKAQQGAWRIKEATLFLIGALFGGVGGLVGMLFFRHKTKHLSFSILFPLYALIDIVAIILSFVYLL